MPRKLGQHFLTSSDIATTAVAELDAKSGDLVVEIGPGTGAITKPLIETGASVIAIEKDRDLAEKLREEYSNKNISIVTEDARDFDPNALNISNYSVIGNIPYYITGRILRILLSANPQPNKIVLILQKEVAERIIERDGKRSILSVAISAYGTPHYVRTIKRGSFNPPPRVDSALLVIDDISRDFFKNIDEEKFFETVKKGFSHKRKTLKKNLGIDEEILKACRISPKARAEELTKKQWKSLVSTIN